MRSSATVLRISPTTFADLVAVGHGGIERDHDERELAVLRQQLASNDVVGQDPVDQRLVVVAFRQLGMGNRGPGVAFSGASAPKTSKATPRVPSMSCTSVTKSRSLSMFSRSRRPSPSTTISTSYSWEGKRRVRSSNCRNSGVLDRNSELSEFVDLELRDAESGERQSAATIRRTRAASAARSILRARNRAPSDSVPWVWQGLDFRRVSRLDRCRSWAMCLSKFLRNHH